MAQLKEISQKPKIRPFGANFSLKKSIKMILSIFYESVLRSGMSLKESAWQVSS